MSGNSITDARHDRAVVVTVDKAYLPPALFVLDQLAADAERSGYDLVLLRAFSENFPIPSSLCGKIRVVDFDEAALPDLVVRDERFAKAMYLRLFIPKLFAQTYSKVIYMDADVHIRHANLVPLFNLEMGDAAVAAVRGVQSFARRTAEHEDYFKGLGLSPGDPYFNSGVLLIAPRAAERQQIFDEARRFASDFPEKCICSDQSALNYVLKGKWIEISPRWNWLSNWTTFFTLQKQLVDRHDPAIVHFNGRRKYWNEPFGFYETPYASAARTFLSGTDWEGFVPPRQRSLKRTYGWARRRLAEEAMLWREGIADRIGAPRKRRHYDNHLRYLTQTSFADVEQGLCPRIA